MLKEIRSIGVLVLVQNITYLAMSQYMHVFILKSITYSVN